MFTFVNPVYLAYITLRVQSFVTALHLVTEFVKDGAYINLGHLMMEVFPLIGALSDLVPENVDFLFAHKT